MTSFADYTDQHIRRRLLDILEGCPDYSTNDRILHSACVAMGFPDRRSKTEAEIEWLRSHNLVRVEKLPMGVLLVTATERGVDVATGQEVYPEIARKAPVR